MQCPECKYVHGWYKERDCHVDCHVEGCLGAFYEVEVIARRKNKEEIEEPSVWACPNCKKLFVDN